MNTSAPDLNIKPQFEICGINVEFKERVFKIHTNDEILEDMVLAYLETEGFFDECTKLYGDDWGIC